MKRKMFHVLATCLNLVALGSVSIMCTGVWYVPTETPEELK